MTPYLITWAIAILSVAGIIIRPYHLPEAIWVVAGSLLLLALHLILPLDALRGIEKGTDVYLFLIGMMLLAEIAREEKLFDWLAAHAINYAKGSSTLLFLLIYVVGIIVTTFLSNDATAVVLTPAVAAAVKSAKVKKPLPYLFICAFIANAASFVLPISNPANLVIYASHMPPLLQWLSTYILPSFFAISITYVLLYWRLRKDIQQTVETKIIIPPLSREGKTAGIAIIATAIILLVSSSFGIQLGLPTAISGALATLIVLVSANKKPWAILKGVSWSILPLVAGLFIIVEALDKTGLITSLSNILKNDAAQCATLTAWRNGTIVAFASNLTNNLPSGLIAGNVVQASGVSSLIKHFVLIGVDLGPNLSVTGSLATILWLVALRREGENVSALTFLKLGIIVMIPALFAAFAALLL
ncbi:arsenic transporter [Ginsengibacter hankyongi]|uniref:Arsenic transporter n=1 Tax=Ginsengibacter hankyongi TaxID=2607284 RepID=A0A5J5IEK1_9BACT|nr:arsenic transporter [Ginsengibacter hankyongi]KAA9037213.1 arsenic transporter [Ginsengibacter hankyongi]